MEAEYRMDLLTSICATMAASPYPASTASYLRCRYITTGYDAIDVDEAVEIAGLLCEVSR